MTLWIFKHRMAKHTTPEGDTNPNSEKLGKDVCIFIAISLWSTCWIVFSCGSPASSLGLPHAQCFSFSRNIGQVTLQIIYFHYLKNILWIKVSKKKNYFILKKNFTESCPFIPTRSEDSWPAVDWDAQVTDEYGSVATSLIYSRHGAAQYTGDLEFIFCGYHLDRAIPIIQRPYIVWWHP